MVVYICQCLSPNSSHSSLPFFVHSLHLHLCTCPANRFICTIFLDSTYMREYTIFVSLYNWTFVPFDHPHSFSPLHHFFVKCSHLEISLFQNCKLLWEVPDGDFCPWWAMCVLTGLLCGPGAGSAFLWLQQQHVCLWLWPHRLWQLCDDALERPGHHGRRAAPGQVSAAGPECQHRDPGADKALGDPDQGPEGTYPWGPHDAWPRAVTRWIHRCCVNEYCSCREGWGAWLHLRFRAAVLPLL